MKPSTVSSQRKAKNVSCSRFLILFLLATLFTCASCTFTPRRSVPVISRIPQQSDDLKESTALSSTDTAITLPRGGAAVTPTIFNIVKSIVGAGVLGLPAGIAAFGNHPSALLPAAVLLIVIGCLAAKGFTTIGTVCAVTKATSYAEAWSRSVATHSAWLPTTACTLVTTCAVTCYSMILKDNVPALAQSLLGVALPKGLTLVGFTSMVLLPLCLLRTLSKLAPFSLVGILGMLYTCSVMLVRWATGAYSGKGTLAHAAAVAPTFGDQGWKSVFSPSSARLISMLSTAYMAHYNAPKFLWELDDPNTFSTATWLSFACAMVLMLGTAAAGFGTFGGASNPLILNNYAPTDVWMNASRLAVTLSLVFSFPLAFAGVRDGWMQLLGLNNRSTKTGAKEGSISQQTKSDLMTVLLLAALTCAALVIQDIGFILSLSGAAFGNLLVYVFPAIMLMGAAKQRPELQSSVPLAVVTAAVGVVMGILGTQQALQMVM